MTSVDPKSLIDQGLGAAITCSFAIPEVGPGIAAALATGKLFFDIFYPPDKSGHDPLTQLPTNADLQNAMNGLKSSVAAIVWANTKGIDQARIVALADNINTKVRNAGSGKTAGDPMPGDTVVWVNSVLDPFWAPLQANPSDIDVIADLIEAKASEKFRSIGLYTFMIGVYLTYCKTAMIFEVNENLKDYQARLATWTALDKAHKNWTLTKLGPEPPLPGTRPVLPSDGDYAVQSEMIDAKSHVVSGYRSYLGKAKGEPFSMFAQMAKDQVTPRLAYLNKVIADQAQAKIDRETFVTGILDQVTVVTDTSSGAAMYHWQNAITGDTGDPVALKAIADAQAAVEKGKLRATYEKRWNDSNTVPDDLTDDDITKLTKTAQAWQDSLDALGTVTQSAATGTASGLFP